MVRNYLVAHVHRRKSPIPWVCAVAILLSYITVGCNLFESENSARNAWKSLTSEPKYRDDPTFNFIEHNPKLPNVFLYGDSISFGYTPVVRGALAGKANVYRLHSNGGPSQNIISHMEKMRSVMRDEKVVGRWTFEWDVIHFNVGLHDIKYIDLSTGELGVKVGKQLTPIPDYKRNLKKGIDYLKRSAPKATLIFATTTPIQANVVGWVEGDAARYNQAGLEVTKSYPKVLINDLYGLTKPNHSLWWAGPDDVHYAPIGREAQGKQVTRMIVKALEAAGRI